MSGLVTSPQIPSPEQSEIFYNKCIKNEDEWLLCSKCDKIY